MMETSEIEKLFANFSLSMYGAIQKDADDILERYKTDMSQIEKYKRFSVHRRLTIYLEDSFQHNYLPNIECSKS